MSSVTNVDAYLAKATKWSEELHRLVEILRTCSTEETIKWGIPVYSYKAKNLVGVSSFKSYFGLWFYQGGFISDPHNVLLNAQEGKTRGMRQWRMTNTKDIRVTWIKALVKESKAVVDKGMELKATRNRPVEIPKLLENEFRKDKSFRAAFDSLSLSCRREYAAYISEAKQEATKLRRLAKILPMISEKIGLNDKYR